MTIKVQVKNMETDWRQRHKVRVTVQHQYPDGIWKDARIESPAILGVGQATTDTWLHPGQRLMVEEING